MTRITDALIQALDDIGYGIHFTTSRDSSQDPYASYLKEDTVGIVLDGGEGVPEGLKGLVVFDNSGMCDEEFEISLAHEYVHARDKLAKDSFSQVKPYHNLVTTLYGYYEKLTDLKALLMLPNHLPIASTSSYLALVDEPSSTLKPAHPEQIQSFLDYARHYGVNNLSLVFGELNKELQSVLDRVRQLKHQYHKSFGNIIIAKVPFVGKRKRDILRQHDEELTYLCNELLKEMPDYLGLLAGFSRMQSADSFPFLVLKANLRVAQKVEEELQRQGIPLIPPQLKTD